MSRMVRTVRRRLARCRALGGDRGSSAIELALLAPTLLFLTLLIVQFALWFEAREAMVATAQDAAQYARTHAFGTPGWQGGTVADADKFYAGLGTRILVGGVHPQVINPVRGPGNVLVVGVTLTGKVNSWLSGVLGQTITVTVEGPEECFHPVDAGGGC